MTLLQNVRHRTVEEHRKRHLSAAARDVPEDCRKGKVAACARDEAGDDEEGRKGKVAAGARDVPDDEGRKGKVARDLHARAVVAAATEETVKTKATTTAAVPKITLLIPPKVTVTTAKSVSSTIASSKASSTSSASSTSVASSTTVSSTSSVVSTTSSTSSHLSTTSLISSSTLDRALPSSTSSSVIPSASVPSSANANADTSSGIKTSTLIGVIAGAAGAVLLVVILAGFFLRRSRTKRKGAEVFNPSEFRRSAVMLDEKDQKPDFRPRPPTMIERHVQGAPANGNNLPPPPSMAYPYSDRASSAPPSAPPSMYGGNGSDHGHHQANYTQYGNIPPPAAGAMYNGLPVVPPPGPYGAHYEQAGYGAPPVPGTYAPGAYASYGPDPRFQQQQFQQQPQYQQQQQQQQQQQGYQQYSSQYQHQPQHPGQYPGGQPYPGVGYGPAPQRMDTLTTSSALPNPFARSPAPSSAPPSPIAEKQSLHLASSSDESSGSGSGLRRQPTQSSGAPPAYVDETGQAEKYRDVKMRPVQLSPLTEYTSTAGGGSTSTSTSASASASNESVGTRANANAAKRTSAYSLYDQEDVYGGI